MHPRSKYNDKEKLNAWRNKNPDKVKAQRKRTYQKYGKKYREKYREEQRKLQREWQINHQDKMKQWQDNWIKNNSEKARLNWLRHTHKRRRNLGFNLIYRNIIDEQFEYHHINNNDVIAIPTDLHKLYCGENHRENLEYIIKQIYK
jgi:hypothetical protein